MVKVSTSDNCSSQNGRSIVRQNVFSSGLDSGMFVLGLEQIGLKNKESQWLGAGMATWLIQNNINMLI